MIAGVCGAALLSGVGCQNALHDQNLALHKQNRELQDRVRALEGELGNRPDAGQVAGLQQELATRDARLASLQQQLQNPPPAPAGGGGEPAPAGIEGIETEFDRATGEMTVRVPGDVLFDPGVATLKPSARGTLDTIAAALNRDYAGRPVRVEGHTDADPLVKTRQQWTDNRGLSAARALAVARYLESKGVDPKRLAAAGMGEHQPRGGDKAKNRRVEIVVVTR